MSNETLLSKEDWVELGGLVAKQYLNAKRSYLRAGTPLKSEVAKARMERLGRLMAKLSAAQQMDETREFLAKHPTQVMSAYDAVMSPGWPDGKEPE